MNVGRDGISADGTIRDTNGDSVGNAVSSRDIYGARSTSGGLEADGTLISTNASNTSMGEFER